MPNKKLNLYLADYWFSLAYQEFEYGGIMVIAAHHADEAKNIALDSAYRYNNKKYGYKTLKRDIYCDITFLGYTDLYDEPRPMVSLLHRGEQQSGLL